MISLFPNALKLEATFQGEMDFINALAFAPDSQTLAVTSYKTNTVVLWDIPTRKRRVILPGHGESAQAIAFSPDSKTLAAAYTLVSGGESKGDAVLWDVQTGAVQGRLQLGGRALGALAFSPDGKTLAAGGSSETVQAGMAVWTKGAVTLWDWAAEKPLATYRDPNGSIVAVAFAPDGKSLAGVTVAGTVDIWSLTDSKRTILDTGGARLTSVQFSPDGQLVAFGSSKNWVCLWDRKSESLRGLLTGHSQEVEAVSFSPDSKRVASASRDRTVRVWKVVDEAPVAQRLAKLRQFRYPGAISAIAVSSDGNKIALGGSAKSIVVWDLGGKEIASQTLSGHSQPICALQMAADGKTLISAASSQDDMTSAGEIKVWDLATGQARQSLTGFSEGVGRIALSGNGKLLASSHRTAKDSMVRIWNLEAGKELCKLKCHEEIFSVAFSGDGKTVATGGATDIKLWDLPAEEELAKAAGKDIACRSQTDAKQVWILTIAFSPDGTTLAAGGGFDLSTTLWDVMTMTKKATLSGKSFAFSPDGKSIATAYAKDNPLQPQLWDVVTARQVLRFQDSHTGAIPCLSFFPKTQGLITGCEDGTVKLWDLKTGRESWDLPE